MNWDYELVESVTYKWKLFFYPCFKFGEFCDSDNEWNTTFLLDFDRASHCKCKFGKDTLIQNIINHIL